jgi:HEAT repeat protein
MVPPRSATFVLSLSFLLTSVAVAQAPQFDKAREAFREGIRKPQMSDRLEGIKTLVETKDPRGTDDLIGAIRTVDGVIAKKREELDRIGKEHREVWKQLDDYIALKRREEAKKEEKQREEERKAKGGAEDEEPPDRVNPPMTAPKELVQRVQAKGEEVQKRLKAASDEMNGIEATRGALYDGVGRLLAIADPAARAPKILELAAAAQRASSFDEKVFFIRLFAVIRAPESRDALIELGRLNTDARVRTAAIAALGDLADPTAVSTLAEALKDEVWSVKTAAAQSLATLPSIDGVPALAEALAKNDGGLGDILVKALEDVTGVTFHDNATLWDNWFKTEGTDIKAALANLDNGEPSIRMTGMGALAAKGTLAGARAMLRMEGLDPPRDVRAKVRQSAGLAPESRPAAKDEVDARRAAIAKTIQSRPKPIRDRAMATLLLEPLAHATALGDTELQGRYLRAVAAMPNASALAMLTKLADRVPSGSPEETEAQERVRLAAVDGLGWQDQDDAVDVLARVLRAGKASNEVKAAAIASLVRLRREAGVRALFEALLEKGAVAEAASKGLKELTKEDFGLDRAKWMDWWNDKGKASTALSARKSPEEIREAGEAEEKKGGTTFYGITTRSKRLLYVLDMSGSMAEGDIQTKGATGGGGGGHTKFWVAKKELKSSITSLPEDALFDIVVFADGVKVWKPQLVMATKEVKAEALKWIENPKEVIAVGATNIFDALEKAFEMAGRGTVDKRYTLNVDTIMFMSDGVANRGRITDPSAIIAEISRMNEHKKVVVNTVGVGKDHDAELMKRIARLNGGTYVARQ